MNTRVIPLHGNLAGRIACALDDLRRRLHRWRVRRHTLQALRRLDALTLRDLGLDASEVPSLAAELSGLASRTRRRAHGQRFF